MIFCSPTVLAAIAAASASGQNADEFISCGGMKLQHDNGHHSSGSSIVDISAMRGGGTAALTSTTDDNSKARVDLSSGILIHRRRQSTATALSTISNEYEDVLAKYHRKQEDSTGTTTATASSLAAERNGKSSFAYSPALQSYRR